MNNTYSLPAWYVDKDELLGGVRSRLSDEDKERIRSLASPLSDRTRLFIERTCKNLDLMFEPIEKKADEPAYIPDPPCEGCEFLQICKTELLACRQFSAYIHAADRSDSPFMDNEEQKWTKYPRIPTRTIYRRIFRQTESTWKARKD